MSSPMRTMINALGSNMVSESSATQSMLTKLLKPTRTVGQHEGLTLVPQQVVTRPVLDASTVVLVMIGSTLAK